MILLLSKLRVSQLELGTITVDVLIYEHSWWIVRTTLIAPTVGTGTLSSGDSVIMIGILWWVHLTRRIMCFVRKLLGWWLYTRMQKWCYLPWLKENKISTKVKIRSKLFWTSISPMQLAAIKPHWARNYPFYAIHGLQYDIIVLLFAFHKCTKILLFVMILPYCMALRTQPW